MEDSIETLTLPIPQTSISPLDSHLSYLILDLLKIDDNETTHQAAPPRTGSYTAPSPIQFGSLQPQHSSDQTYQTGFHNSLFLPSQLFPSAMPANSVITGEESSPNWDWLRGNILFSFESAHQDGESDSATWLRGGEDELMKKGLNFNNGFGSESPGMDNFAAARRIDIYSVSGDSWQSDNEHELDWLEAVDVLEVAMNENGSKRLQEIVAQKDERKINMIFKKTLPGMLLMMTNKYGQFFFSRLIESLNPSQLDMIIEKVTNEVETLAAICCDQNGSLCVKRLIIVLEKSPLVARITLALSCRFFELMTHKTGSFVILKCFEVLNNQQNMALHCKLLDKCLELATHETGCVSLNRSISHTKGKVKDYLLRKISMKAAYLAHDPSGNYVIQVVMGLANPTFTEIICQQLKGHYVELSKEVGGSHVVEKCLRSEDRHHAIQDLLKCDKLGHLAKDRFGNYVLQTALRETKRAGSPLYEPLLIKIVSLKELHQGYGKKVVSFINKGVPLEG